jgi:hypothetical protein
VRVIEVAYFGVMPAACTTFCHLAASLATIFP